MNLIAASDAIRRYAELNLSASSADKVPLDEEALAVLERVAQRSTPGLLAGQLAAALRTLWVAQKSGDNEREDTDNTLCLLAEFASLIENAAEVHDDAIWFLKQQEGIDERGSAAGT